MCFSAPVSFISAAVLGTAGICTLKMAKDKRGYLLASFPLLFGIQQLIEGITWLYLTGALSDEAPYCFRYMFLFYSNVLWPLLIPISALLIEPHNIRKKMMYLLTFMGIGTSLYLFYIISFGVITSEIQGDHIRYRLFDISFFEHIKWIYLFVVSAPLLLSSYKWLITFGFSILIAFAVTDYFAHNAYLSIWCFCAAILSLIIYMHFRQQKKL